METDVVGKLYENSTIQLIDDKIEGITTHCKERIITPKNDSVTCPMCLKYQQYVVFGTIEYDTPINHTEWLDSPTSSLSFRLKHKYS